MTNEEMSIILELLAIIIEQVKDEEQAKAAAGLVRSLAKARKDRE